MRRERGTVALVRGNTACRCVVVVRERGKVGRLASAVVLVAFRRDVRAVLITASPSVVALVATIRL